MRKASLVAAVGGLVFLGLGQQAGAVIVANSVVSYAQGDFTVTPQFKNYTSTSAALGLLEGDTGFGGMNPFNPAFATNQVVAICPGGQLTLHLSAPAPTNGKTLGVVSNSGLLDVSLDGSGAASTPAQTLDEAFGSTDPEAIVRVSQNGTDFVSLNGGNPILFLNPANYYLDSTISNFDEPLGTVPADQSKPFLGSLSDFSGLTYGGMKTLLDGSAGGTWLDLSGTGLSSVNFVQFQVPSTATYGMAVDSVSAVPEPAMGLSLLTISMAAMARRRSRTM